MLCKSIFIKNESDVPKLKIPKKQSRWAMTWDLHYPGSQADAVIQHNRSMLQAQRALGFLTPRQLARRQQTHVFHHTATESTITCFIKQSIAHEHDLVQSNCNLFLQKYTWTCIYCYFPTQLDSNNTASIFNCTVRNCHENYEQDRNINSRSVLLF